MTPQDEQLLRLAARLLRQELDYHGWREMKEAYGDCIVGLSESDVAHFVARWDPQPPAEEPER